MVELPNPIILNANQKVNWGTHISCSFGYADKVILTLNPGQEYKICAFIPEFNLLLEYRTKNKSPRFQFYPCAVVFEDKLAILGEGISGREYLNILDLGNMTWTPHTPREHEWTPGLRTQKSGWYAYGKLWFFGGSKFNPVGVTNELLCYDPSLQEHNWSLVRCSGDIPNPRKSHTTVNMGNGKVVLFGGTLADRYGSVMNDVHVLDMGMMRWEKIDITGLHPEPRYDHCAVILDSRRMEIWGGRNNSTMTAGDNWILNLEERRWERGISAFNAGRGHISAINIKNNIYIYGAKNIHISKRYPDSLKTLALKAISEIHDYSTEDLLKVLPKNPTGIRKILELMRMKKGKIVGKDIIDIGLIVLLKSLNIKIECAPCCRAPKRPNRKWPSKRQKIITEIFSLLNDNLMLNHNSLLVAK